LSYQNKKQQTKKIIFSFLFILILIITCIPIKAQSTTGGYAEMYLHRDYGTRPIALAGAYTAISDDPTTILYNPAGLSF
jgi:hypothetical protein